MFLRQQKKRSDKQSHYSLSDFILPKSSGKRDHIGLFAVTMGDGVENLADYYSKQDDDYKNIMIKAIGDRLAEAYAELMHKKLVSSVGLVRIELNYK